MMLRIFIVAGILGVMSAEGMLTISSMKRLLDGVDYQIQIEFSSTGFYKAKTVGDIILEIEYTDENNKDQQITLHAIDPLESSPKFKYDLKELNGEKVQLLLRTGAATGEIIDWGKVETFTLPEFLDELTFSGCWIGDASDVASLRVDDKTSVHGFNLGDISCTVGGSICHFVGVTPKIDGPTEFCQTLSIDICDVTLTILAEAYGDVTTLSAIELTYPIQTSNAQITVTPKKNLELVLYQKETVVDQDTVLVCDDIPCKLDAYEPSIVIHQILVVELSTDSPPVPSKSQIFTIQDHEVVGTGLSADLVETRWTRGEGDSDEYFVSRTTQGDEGDNFHETTVTCTEENNVNAHCFAYFVGLVESTKYDLTVQTSQNDLHKVTLKDTETQASTKYEDMKMEISSLDSKWHKGLRRFEINICLHHVDTSNLASYQAIVVNKRGQWNKLTGVTHRIENEFCFEALHLDIHNFDLSEDLTLAVVKRGHDEITVLESAQTIISVAGN